MNEELQTVLAEFVKGFTATGKGVVDFATVQIPDVVQQALMWYGIYNFLLFIGAVIIACTGTYLNVKIFKWNKKTNNGDLLPIMFTTIPATILSACMMFNLDWLKIWIAPKLWLIEFAASLATNVGGK